MKLSKRLQRVADHIKQYKEGDVLADIGTDHAYLPCYLVENKIVKKAYACDVARGPYESSLSTIRNYHIDHVEALLGNGIDPIVGKDVDMIAMAGMGSYLISEIMEQHLDYLKNVKVLFLQPNANSDHLRKYLFEHHYDIVHEDMIEDGQHIYDIMVVKHQTTQHDYNEYDIEFGPILRDNPSTLFMTRWKKQYHVYQRIMKDLDEQHPRYQELSHKMKMIEEVLHESL